jgi:hypothetical protein
MQIHDDIAHNRVEDFIRGDDNETLVGTEDVAEPKRRKVARSNTEVKARAAAAEVV